MDIIGCKNGLWLQNEFGYWINLVNEFVKRLESGIWFDKWRVGLKTKNDWIWIMVNVLMQMQKC